MTVVDPPTWQVRIDPGLDPEVAELARRVVPSLAHVLQKTYERVTVEWEPAEVGGEPAARLRLTNDGVSRAALFTESDLSDEPEARWRFLQLWGDVLDEHLRLIRDRMTREEG